MAKNGIVNTSLQNHDNGIGALQYPEPKSVGVKGDFSHWSSILLLYLTGKDYCSTVSVVLGETTVEV